MYFHGIWPGQTRYVLHAFARINFILHFSNNFSQIKTHNTHTLLKSLTNGDWSPICFSGGEITHNCLYWGHYTYSEVHNSCPIVNVVLVTLRYLSLNKLMVRHGCEVSPFITFYFSVKESLHYMGIGMGKAQSVKRHNLENAKIKGSNKKGYGPPKWLIAKMNAQQ